MRANIFAGLFAIGLAGALAGCPAPTCKDKTVLVTATFDAASRAADSLQIVVEVDGNAQPAAPIAGPRGSGTGTMQVEFPHGYHAGSTITVTVAAQLGGQTVATGSASTTLMAGCTVLPLSVGAGGGEQDMANPLDMLQLPKPVVTAKPDLVGFITNLDASASSDPLGGALTFTWAIQLAPAGSTITTAALVSTTATKTSFEPDRGGVYKVALTASASDGRTATTVADVTVPTAPLFYTRASETTTIANIGARVIASDGTGDHAIGCSFTSDGGLTSSTIQAMPFFGHAWEPPTAAAGTPLYAFFSIVDTTVAPHLVVGTSSTDCTTSPPTRVDNNQFNDHIPVSARFSPDGKRIVYVDMPQDQSMATFRLVTV
ncbi:MAG: hypothetical protein JWM53_1520, partial [bacterium]|nr:hypothetical protein [bacterium]